MGSVEIDEVSHAIIEACINAREHACCRDERIYLRFLGGITKDGERSSRSGSGTVAWALTLEGKTPRTGLLRSSSQTGLGLQIMRAHVDDLDIESGSMAPPFIWSNSPRDDAMTDDLKVTVQRRGDAAVLYTRGYINNLGGEEIASRAYELMDDGIRTLILNLHETKIVNSIGISILIEVIEKMTEKEGRSPSAVSPLSFRRHSRSWPCPVRKDLPRRAERFRGARVSRGVVTRPRQLISSDSARRRAELRIWN